MKSNGRDIKLTTVDDLFSTEESRTDDNREKVMDIPLTELHKFKNHPFQVNQDAELKELAKSIQESGVVVPAIARPRKSGGYELIAGHRRKAACELAGLETMPVIVRELDDDTAVVSMVDSNQQRENLLPSEKAFSYRMKLEAIKRQGKRTDLTSGQVGQKSKNKVSAEIIGEDSGDSYKQVQRYIRLTFLIPPILRMVDEKKMAFNPAVAISYLLKEEQKILAEAMEALQCTPSLSQANLMKGLSQEEKFDHDAVLKILSEEKPNQREKLSIRKDKLVNYFPKDYTPKQMEETILQLLKDWKRRLQRKAKQR